MLFVDLDDDYDPERDEAEMQETAALIRSILGDDATNDDDDLPFTELLTED